MSFSLLAFAVGGGFGAVWFSGVLSSVDALLAGGPWWSVGLFCLFFGGGFAHSSGFVLVFLRGVISVRIAALVFSGVCVGGLSVRAAVARWVCLMWPVYGSLFRFWGFFGCVVVFLGFFRALRAFPGRVLVVLFPSSSCLSLLSVLSSLFVLFFCFFGFFWFICGGVLVCLAFFPCVWIAILLCSCLFGVLAFWCFFFGFFPLPPLVFLFFVLCCSLLRVWVPVFVVWGWSGFVFALLREGGGML